MNASAFDFGDFLQLVFLLFINYNNTVLSIPWQPKPLNYEKLYLVPFEP